MFPFKLSLLFSAVLVGSMAAPQYYLHNAVKQAHNWHLLPPQATVDKTAPGIQVAYYNIKPNEKANLNSALGGSIPYDVIQSLESQIDAIGAYPYVSEPAQAASSVPATKGWVPYDPYKNQRGQYEQRRRVAYY